MNQANSALKGKISGQHKKQEIMLAAAVHCALGDVLLRKSVQENVSRRWFA